MRILWFGGWGISVDFARSVVCKRFPDYSHEFLTPGSQWRERGELLLSNVDTVVAYSMGAHLLLGENALLDRCKSRILLAPFWNLTKEAGLGGRIALTQLKFQLRQLRRDPVSAMNDFYKRAEISFRLEDELPYELEDLEWGLETLISGKEPCETLAFQQVIIGEEDSLLDAFLIKNQFEQDVDVIPNVGHDFADLVNQISCL